MTNYTSLFESLFGATTQNRKLTFLTEEESKLLQSSGYDPVSWDYWLEIGKITKDDVRKRVELEKFRIDLDRDLKKRWEAKRPQVKKDDVIITKNYGKLMIRNTDKWGVTGYSSSYGQLLQISWDSLIKEMEQK